MRYRTAYNGEWVEPHREKFYLQCCRCGLTHRMQFRLVRTPNGRGRRIQFRAHRLPRRRKR